MIKSERWVTIKSPKGFSRYQVSDNLEVRVASTKRVLDTQDYAGGKLVRLTSSIGRMESFKVDELMLEAFNKNEVDYDEIPDIKFPDHPNQFSKFEDDYGKGVFDEEWSVLKKELNEIKRLKGLM